jgi:hypothetical protein
MMTLDQFLADMNARAAAARHAGDSKRATELEEAAKELDAAYKAHQAAEGKKIELFLRASHTDKALGRVVLEPHETATEHGAGPAWAALERLEEAFERCQQLMYRG